ncbi:MAG: hypothetical protein IKL13_05445 [Clostridia bacterium]|nr:hypothetical protein [Clostridia bacterium]
MKIKSLLLIALALCLTVCLCACGDDTPADNDTSKTTQAAGNDTTATTTTTTQAETTTTASKANVALYTVTVTDEAGNPISGAFVQFCLESCVPCMTNAEGVASYQTFVNNYKVSFISVPEGYEKPTEEYYFEEGSYEMTLVLKAAA